MTDKKAENLRRRKLYHQGYRESKKKWENQDRCTGDVGTHYEEDWWMIAGQDTGVGRKNSFKVQTEGPDGDRFTLITSIRPHVVLFREGIMPTTHPWTSAKGHINRVLTEQMA